MAPLHWDLNLVESRRAASVICTKGHVFNAASHTLLIFFPLQQWWSRHTLWTGVMLCFLFFSAFVVSLVDFAFTIPVFHSRVCIWFILNIVFNLFFGQGPMSWWIYSLLSYTTSSGATFWWVTGCVCVFSWTYIVLISLLDFVGKNFSSPPCSFCWFLFRFLWRPL